MYLINSIEGVDYSKLHKLHQNIETIGFGNTFLTTLMLDFSEDSIKECLQNVDLALIDDSIIKELNLNDIDEIIYNHVMDIAECRKHILVKYCGEMSVVLNRFIEYCKEVGVQSISYNIDGNFKYPDTLDDLQSYDLPIIFEVFGKQFNQKTIVHRPSHGLISCSIDKYGVIRNKFNEVKGHLDNPNQTILDILNFTSKEKELMTGLFESGIDNIVEGFNTLFYSPSVVFLDGTYEERVRKIVNYKYSIFNIVRNIDPEDYEKLPAEVSKLLNLSSFVKFDDILSILTESEDI